MPGHRWMAHAAMGNLETAFEALKTARWPASDAAFTAGNDVPPDLETRAHGARRARRRLAGTYGFATSLLSPGASIAVDNGLQLHPDWQSADGTLRRWLLAILHNLVLA
ncbi:unnamed protein product [Cladocopium goreaui]|uniref:Uncharacterized protein n=1 Tax=Cladocopium goreaui TaxID=2562237 RepID=A0A9P1GGB1_9DINO|nr:unnamed protein product [Cladocopium goreaui]